MVTNYWQDVLAADLVVPRDRPLADLTTELTQMLGSPDPDVRDAVAYPVLATWIDRGVFDDLLAGLGDGMVAGLQVGLGEHDTDTVFRRSFSALVLAECIRRDNTANLLPAAKILEWGDRAMTWLLAEKDVRGFVPGSGWAHALAHGADILGTLAQSRHFAAQELFVILDVVAHRLLAPTARFTAGEEDRFALATMRVLDRNLLDPALLDSWIARIGAAASAEVADGEDPYVVRGNAEAFLRALHLQLAIGDRRPSDRADILLTVIAALRSSNAPYLTTG